MLQATFVIDRCVILRARIPFAINGDERCAIFQLSRRLGSATLCQKYYLLCYSLMLLKFTHYAFENYPLFQYYAL